VPKYAEECVRVAQSAKPRHRAMLLNIASKWLELSAYDEWTQVLLSADESKEDPDPLEAAIPSLIPNQTVRPLRSPYRFHFVVRHSIHRHILPRRADR
jgi:hypothetical protein